MNRCQKPLAAAAELSEWWWYHPHPVVYPHYCHSHYVSWRRMIGQQLSGGVGDYRKGRWGVAGQFPCPSLGAVGIRIGVHIDGASVAVFVSDGGLIAEVIDVVAMFILLQLSRCVSSSLKIVGGCLISRLSLHGESFFVIINSNL